MYSNPFLLSLLPDYLLSPPILTGDLVCNLMKKLEGASWTTANFPVSESPWRHCLPLLPGPLL